jgi:hypothetical protein
VHDALKPQETMRRDAPQVRLHQQINLLPPVLAADTRPPEHLLRDTSQHIRLDNNHNIKSDRISDCDGRTMLIRSLGVKEQFLE